MEDIIGTLKSLINTTNTQCARDTTDKLKNYMQDVNAVRCMFAIVLNYHEDDVVVKAFATILGRHLTTERWHAVCATERQEIKEGLLRKLENGIPQKLINSLVQLIAHLAIWEADDAWNRQLVVKTWEKLYSSNSLENEYGSFILARLASDASFLLTRYAMKELCDYVGEALNFAISNQTYITDCLLNVYFTMGTVASDRTIPADAAQFFVRNLPTLLTIMHNVRSNSYVFDTIMGVVEGVLSLDNLEDQIPMLVDTLLHYIVDYSLDEAIRHRVFDALESTLSAYFHMVQNRAQVFEVTFAVLAHHMHLSKKWDPIAQCDRSEQINLFGDALRIMDCFACDMEPQALSRLMLETLVKARDSESMTPPSVLNTFYSLLGVLVETVHDFAGDNLNLLMTVILYGLRIEVPCLWNSALYAAQRFAEILKCQMRKFVGIVLRRLMMLFDIMLETCQAKSREPLVPMMFRTVKIYLNLLKDDTMVELPLVLNQMVKALSVSRNELVTYEALSTLTTLIAIAKTDFDPYLNDFVKLLANYAFDVDDQGKVLTKEKPLDNGVEAILAMQNMLKYSSDEALAPHLDNLHAYARHLLNDPRGTEFFTACVLELVACLSIRVHNNVEEMLPKTMQIVSDYLRPSDFFDSDIDDTRIDEEVESCFESIQVMATNAPVALYSYSKILMGTCLETMSREFENRSLFKLCNKVTTALLPIVEPPLNNEPLCSALKNLIRNAVHYVERKCNIILVSGALESIIDLLTAFRPYLANNVYVIKLIYCLVLKIFNQTLAIQMKLKNNSLDIAVINPYIEELYILNLELIPILASLQDQQSFRTLLSSFWPTFSKFISNSLNQDNLKALKPKVFKILSEIIEMLKILTVSELQVVLNYIYGSLKTAKWCLVRDQAMLCLGTLVYNCDNFPDDQCSVVLEKISQYCTEFGEKDGYGCVVVTMAKVLFKFPSGIQADIILPEMLRNMPMQGFQKDHLYVLNYFQKVLQLCPGSRFIDDIIAKSLESLLRKKSMDPQLLEPCRNLIRLIYTQDPTKFNQIQSPEYIDAIRSLLQ